MSPNSSGARLRAMPHAAHFPAPNLDRKRALIARQIERFPRRVRAPVAFLASRHDRLAELALSFPALLFALAVRRRHVDAEAGIASVIAGAGLAELAAHVRLPLWTRKLQPQALRGPLPDLPDSPLFRRQIGNILPKPRCQSWTFLSVLSMATAWCDENFAIWCAREFVQKPKGFDVQRVRTMALWAWHSHHPEAVGHRHCETRWHPFQSFKTAVEAAELWLEAMQNHLAAGPTGRLSMWFSPAEVDGFTIAPLDTADAVIEEAAAMKNCLRWFGEELLDNTCRFWSVRREGERRAVFSVGRDHDDPIPSISELKGPRNKPADLAVWIAVAKWLQMQDLAAVTADRPAKGSGHAHHRVWLETWKPYWLSRGYISYRLPLRYRSNWKWRLQRAVFDDKC